MRFTLHYESDWRSKHGAEEIDDTAPDRQALLKTALAPFIASAGAREYRILDASCAAGKFAQFLENLGCRVVAMDIAWSAVRQATQRFDPTRLLVAADEALPFADSSFDAVWCGETIAQVFDVHQVLREFNRALRPGGQVLITTPYHGLIKNLLLSFSFEQHFYPENYRIRFFTPASFEKVLKHNGFTLELWRGFGRSWPVWKSFFAVARKTGPSLPPPHWHRHGDPQYDRYSDSPFGVQEYFRDS